MGCFRDLSRRRSQLWTEFRIYVFLLPLIIGSEAFLKDSSEDNKLIFHALEGVHCNAS